MKSFMLCSTTKHAQHEPVQITIENGTKPSKWVGTKVALNKRLCNGYNNHVILPYVPQDNDIPEAVQCTLRSYNSLSEWLFQWE